MGKGIQMLSRLDLLALDSLTVAIQPHIPRRRADDGAERSLSRRRSNGISSGDLRHLFRR